MKKCLLVVMVVLGMMLPSIGFGEVDLVIGLHPGSVLFSPDADGFESYDSRNGEYEEVDGYASWIPSIRAGLGIDTEPLYFDLTAGVGYAYGGDVYTATYYVADAAARFKLHGADGKGVLFTFGPHASVVYFDPKWKGDTGVELKETIGFMVGPAFTVGKKAVSFSASLDYIHLPVDVDKQSGVYTNDDEFDLSGIALQLGIIFRF